MRLKRSASKSSKKLSLGFQRKRIKLTKSTKELPAASNPLSNSKTTVDSEYFPLGISQVEETIFLRVENEEIKSKLQEYPIFRNVSYATQVGDSLQKSIVIVSKIEEFALHYSQLCTEICDAKWQVRWFVISRAVNSKDIEKDFNSRYDPIVFNFISGLSQVVNFINFGNLEPTKYISFDFFSKIINFEAYYNTLACVQQKSSSDTHYKATSQNQLWLLKPTHRKTILNKNSRYYFLSSMHKSSGTLIIPDLQSDVTYVIQEDYENLVNSQPIKQIEQKMTVSKVRKYLLENLSQSYIKKVVPKYFKNQILLCLINFPDKVAKEFVKQFETIVILKEISSVLNQSMLYIDYNQSSNHNCLQIDFNKSARIENQLFRIKKYHEALQKIKQEYSHIEVKNISFEIAAYNIKDSGIVSQVQILSKMLVKKITNIEEALKQSGNMVLIGHFSQNQKQNLTKKQSLSIIDTQECEGNSLVVHNQVIIALSNLSKIESSITYLPLCPRIIIFDIEFSQFKSDPVIFYRSIAQFSETLEQLQQNCKHTLVMRMENYNQSIEKYIKQTEELHQISFEVYLQFGSEFIIRSKSSKYQFLKREDLINRIRDVSSKNQISRQFNSKASYLLDSIQSVLWSDDYDAKIHSQLRIPSKCEELFSFPSSPNIHDQSAQELLVVCPKNLPFHNTLSRFGHYPVLVYHDIDQLRYFFRNIGRKYYAAVIVCQKQNLRYLNGASMNSQIIVVQQQGENKLRQSIDNIAERFRLKKKREFVNKSQQGCPVVLFDHNDPKQVKLMHHMVNIFKQSKAISVSKEQYQTLRENLQIANNLILYQLGNQQISGSKKISNVTELLKIYMSPKLNSIQFSASQIQFSQRQLFLFNYYDRFKKGRFKGRLHDLSQSKSQSPRSSNLKAKQCTNEVGLRVLESRVFSTASKRQKFQNVKELISLAYIALNKGNTVVVILKESQFVQFTKYCSKRIPGMIWIIAVQNSKNLLVRQQNQIYCLTDKIQTILNQISALFRTFRQQHQPSQQSEYFGESVINIKHYSKWSEYLQDSELQTNHSVMKIVTDHKIKTISAQKLGESLLFRDEQKVSTVIQWVQKPGRKSRKDELLEEGLHNDQNIVILIHLHNKLFIQECLSLLQDRRCLVITFSSLFNVMMYAQITKTLLITEQKDEIKIPGVLILRPTQTPSTFSSKLKFSLESLRKWDS